MKDRKTPTYYQIKAIRLNKVQLLYAMFVASPYLVIKFHLEQKIISHRILDHFVQLPNNACPSSCLSESGDPF